MTLDAWITLAVIVGMCYTFLHTKVKVDVVYLFAIAVLMFTGVLTPVETFQGFTSNAALVSAMLAVIVAAMRHSGALQVFTQMVFGEHKSMRQTLLKLMGCASFISAFSTNTSTGGILFGSATDWARKHGIRPSHVLLPIAFAISLGAACTTIGSSANILLFDMLHDLTGTTSGVFTPLAGGLVCTLCVMGLVLAFQKRVPDCDDVVTQIANSRDYIADFVIPSDSRFIGMTYAEAGIYASDSFFLQKVTPYLDDPVGEPDPMTMIMGGDHITLIGNLEKMLDLSKRKGLIPSAEAYVLSSKTKKNRVTKLVSILKTSELCGQTLRERSFEETHHITVVAAYRSGSMFNGGLRDVVLQEGDTLLVQGSKASLENLELDFAPITTEDIIIPTWRTWLTLGLMSLTVLLASLGVLPIIYGAFFSILVFGITGCTSHERGWSSIAWTTITIIAGAKALVTAMTISGLTGVISKIILLMCGGGTITSLIVITAITIAMTQILFDNAVVSIVLPIALGIATQVGANPLTFAVAILLAVSSNFCTPYSTAHMTMVAAQGQYTHRQMFAYGWPFCLCLLVVIVASVLVFYPL